ncbi:MAG: hypothetical protein Q8O15_02130 [Rectinemataceae bacterium]|nr:hypothetical protein [Rectinemataceae bacterium]
MIAAKAMKKIDGFIMAILLCSLSILSSCRVESSDWYPSGKATIASHFEYSNSDGKGCVSTIEIINTGMSSINRCAVSLSAATDARVYHQTAVKEMVIPPGKRAYFDIEIAFVSEDESLKETGLVIEDSFYL